MMVIVLVADALNILQIILLLVQRAYRDITMVARILSSVVRITLFVRSVRLLHLLILLYPLLRQEQLQVPIHLVAVR